MGEVIDIQEHAGIREFRIAYTTTLEERTVFLDPDKQDLFFNNPPVSTLACPFLREHASGRVICTVHLSRPELCRQYSCFRILILDTNGVRAGKVPDKTRVFTATDLKAHEIWKNECRSLDIPDDTAWEDEITRIFIRAGYRVVK